MLCSTQYATSKPATVNGYQPWDVIRRSRGAMVDNAWGEYWVSKIETLEQSPAVSWSLTPCMYGTGMYVGTYARMYVHTCCNENWHLLCKVAAQRIIPPVMSLICISANNQPDSPSVAIHTLSGI